MEMSLFFQLFAGVSVKEMDAFPLVPLGRWLFPIGIYLLIIGFRLGRNKQNRRFVIIRCGRIQKWWKHYFWRNLLQGAFAAVCFPALFGLMDLIVLQMFTGDRKETTAIFVLWTVHAMVLSALFLFLETLKIKKLIPAVILLLEGLTFLNGFRFKEIAGFMFGSWGMYVQSNLKEGRYGFSAIRVMLVQAAVIMACYWLGGYLLKRREMEGV